MSEADDPQLATTAQAVLADDGDARTFCTNCSFGRICLPNGYDKAALHELHCLVEHVGPFRGGHHLFRVNDAFGAVYSVRAGMIKTYVVDDRGREQVTGFQMAGEIIGLDGIVSDRHSCNAIALEDAEVCVMPFANVEDLSREFPVLQRHVHKIMSREIVRENGVMMLLGNMRAEERLAAFLLNLVQRLHARGFSRSELVLRMTREEIGTYLGLKLETVSRCFSKFQDDGVLQVRQRQIRIVDQAALEKIVNGHAC